MAPRVQFRVVATQKAKLLPLENHLVMISEEEMRKLIPRVGWLATLAKRVVITHGLDSEICHS